MITPQVVDWLLYNRHDLRAEIGAFGLAPSAGVIVLPVRRRPDSSPVEYVAISRAAITVVLDAVDEAVDQLPRSLRRLVYLRYTCQLPIRAVARRIHWSERTCFRKLDRVRERLVSRLSLLGDGILAEFWQTVGRVLADR